MEQSLRSRRLRGPQSSSHRNSQDATVDAQTARRSHVRYLALAKAAVTAGDPIAAENYYQHADHYFRQMAAESFTVDSDTKGRR